MGIPSDELCISGIPEVITEWFPFTCFFIRQDQQDTLDFFTLSSSTGNLKYPNNPVNPVYNVY